MVYFLCAILVQRAQKVRIQIHGRKIIRIQIHGRKKYGSRYREVIKVRIQIQGGDKARIQIHGRKKYESRYREEVKHGSRYRGVKNMDLDTRRLKMYESAYRKVKYGSWCRKVISADPDTGRWKLRLRIQGGNICGSTDPGVKISTKNSKKNLFALICWKKRDC